MPMASHWLTSTMVLMIPDMALITQLMVIRLATTPDQPPL